MKILFINPPTDNMIRSQVSKEVQQETGFQPPLGILYLSSYIRKNSSHEVRVIDSPVEKISYGELQRSIGAYQPQIVGITVNTFTMPDVLRVVQNIKKENESTLVCLGGCHVDIYPRETINLPGIDFSIRGEGEISFKELIDTLEQGHNLDSIKGLVFKKDEKIIINEPRENISDLDDLPYPARDLIPWQKYYSIVTRNRPTTSLLTAKGCPYNCIFCYKHGGNNVRYRSVKSVLNEIEECLDLGIKEIFFEDETFTLNKKRLFEFCAEVKKKGVAFPWGARARVDTLNNELLTMFEEIGCVRLHIGVEAGTEKILKVLRKKITLEQVRDVFRRTRKLGIISLAYFMIGSPEENEEEIKSTIKFSCQIDPDYSQFSITTPFPATDLYKLGLEKGLYKDYWKEFAVNPRSTFRPKFWEGNVDAERLRKLLTYAQRRFYLRPKYILRKMREISSFAECKEKVKAGIKMLMR